MTKPLVTFADKLAVINRAYGTHFTTANFSGFTRETLSRLYETASITRLTDELDPAGA